MIGQELAAPATWDPRPSPVTWPPGCFRMQRGLHKVDREKGAKGDGNM